MTQAHLNLQSQLDSQNISIISDPSTTPLCNTSPILFLIPIEPKNNQPEQLDTNHITSKSSDTDEKPPEQSISTPPPSKKKIEIMKAPIFLTSPVYPPVISPKDSISTQRDDYLIPILSTENFTFKSQLTSLYMHPTDYTFKLNDKNQDFSTSIASKIMTPYFNGLTIMIKSSHFSSIFSDRQDSTSKLMKMTLLFSPLRKKQLIITHTLHFSNIKNQKITFS